MPSVTTVCTMPLMSALPSLALVWPSNCGIGQLDADHRGEALADVVARQVGFLLREGARLARPRVQRARERSPEAGHVRAAVDRVDVVGEGEHRLGESVVVLKGDLDAGGADQALDVDRPRVEHVAAPVQVPHEAGDAALEVEVLLGVDPLVSQADPEALVQVRRLAKPGADRLPAEVERLEDLRIGLEEGPRPVGPLPGRIEAAVGLGGAAVRLHRRPSGCRARTPGHGACRRAAPRRASRSSER